MSDLILELKNIDVSNAVSCAVDKNVPKAMDNDTNGIDKFIGLANMKFLRKLAHASYIKFRLSSPLNTSSVKRVQYLMYLLDPLTPNVIMKKLVHNPTQVYTGRNAKP